MQVSVVALKEIFFVMQMVITICFYIFFSGIIDCVDGTDEVGCTINTHLNRTCSSGQFSCNSGECVSKLDRW